ncbi:centrosomal protein of 44 kDa-like [Lytechinus variegatus]|uniref:centrosomal protein of 44 kDa-like n=1 Tax=Lytechinus variegatus TaxID=7654 RepID=UPI001BB0D965|nr:centrosomal protein of 44 kDa-like [Lytechinus variegatus]XP_041473208.1 centrosomal protein of 44 kDa-like [Lytechinus variegatus]XP_041473287.1 centrosomal protein of 44 kDa-like [Lytechinus variegatus]XP_041473370.1 centrosomal protein of 44 kDa-like [Lytechinus variegatus]XP_041473454.1 centrosomal protein of 44 kDa-like [Lytechinus variegatus]XP_041473539.1 centrosomal protein of 44 kDa-like [Lytechinus variegatus]
MATGDVKGNIKSLQTELKRAKYPKELDYISLAKGSPKEFLPIMHFMLCDYSRPVSQLILDRKIDLAAKNDQKFMEAVYKVLRDLFHYVPRITGPQFFSRGFAEHKILLTREVVSMVRNKHKDLTRGKTPLRTLAEQGSSESIGSRPTSRKVRVLDPDVIFTAHREDFLNSTEISESAEHKQSVSIIVGKTPVPLRGYSTQEYSPDNDLLLNNNAQTDLETRVQKLEERVRNLEERLLSELNVEVQNLENELPREQSLENELPRVQNLENELPRVQNSEYTVEDFEDMVQVD